ncbi:metallophosphoesterase family protein [uncultured Thiohalocapsa sp.]|uniref:metallophosphoesterase family protein n=1 Tax=uncultured Thiohalocapsa sp. TaxID=768990 RepID=UPI0025EAEA18|nr:metallophosphoesterase family protein [uncultured Thiohalocapsa sp.]
MLQVAILSDTHGVIDDRIADLVADCDLAVHGGDIGAAEVLTRLKPRSGRVAAVLGNNDVRHKWPAAEQHLLDTLPLEITEDLPGGRLVVVHGHRTPAKDRHARLRRRFPDARAIVYGHSHRLVADQDDAPWVLNPGAAGRERTFGGPSCLVLTARHDLWSLAVHRFPPAGGAQPRERSRR